MDDATLSRLGYLSRILLEDDERSLLAQDLRRILLFIDTIKSTATDDIEPLAHPLDTVQALRDDSAIGAIERDDYQQIAKHTMEGFYIVPRVIDP